MSGTKQLDLFGARARGAREIDPRKLRQRIPSGIRFGTLDWCHPAWGDLVWSRPRRADDLERNGLSEYAAHPRFSTLCLTPGSEPFSEQTLRRYAAQLPTGFGVVVEAHALVTTPRFTRTAGSTRDHLRANPSFFDARRFDTESWRPAATCFGDRLHWLLLLFPEDMSAAGIPPAAFAARLEGFLAAVPNPARCAIEVRDAEYLTLDYARVLASTGAATVFSTAPKMPTLAEQANWAPTASEAIFRLADPVAGQYPSATERRTAVIDEVMAHPQRRAVILVGDGAEGSAPETIDRLLALTADRFALEPDVALAGGALA